MEQEGLSLFSLAFTFDFKKHAWDENCVLNSDPVTMLKLPELCPECQPGSGGQCLFPRGCKFNSLNALHVSNIQETTKWRRHYPCLQGAYRTVDISECIVFFELSKSENRLFCFLFFSRNHDYLIPASFGERKPLKISLQLFVLRVSLILTISPQDVKVSSSKINKQWSSFLIIFFLPCLFSQVLYFPPILNPRLVLLLFFYPVLLLIQGSNIIGAATIILYFES